jgi:hypothetical protein
VGVRGQGGTGTGAGVYGTNGSGSGYGVWGINGSNIGVLGTGSKAMAADGANFGISATASAVGTGIAVYARANNNQAGQGAVTAINDNASTSNVSAIFGQASSGAGATLVGVTGLVAVGTSVGISATASGPAGIAVKAEVNSVNAAIIGVNNSTSINTPAVYGSATGSGTGVQADVFLPSANSKAIDASVNTPTGFGAWISNPGTLGATLTQGAALFVSGTIKTSGGVFLDGAASGSPWTVNAGTPLTFGPSGSVRSSGASKTAVTRIIVNHPQVTPSSTVIISWVHAVPPINYSVSVAAGSFNIWLPSTSFDTTGNQGFNFLIINQ